MSAYSLEPIIVTEATATLDYDIHNNALTIVNRAAGCTITLPSDAPIGAHFHIVVGTTISSNSFVVTTSGSMTMVGTATSATATTGAGTHEALTATDDTITMSGTTTGGIVGSEVEVWQISATQWLVRAHLVGSGSLASPVS